MASRPGFWIRYKRKFGIRPTGPLTLLFARFSGASVLLFPVSVLLFLPFQTPRKSTNLRRKFKDGDVFFCHKIKFCKKTTPGSKNLKITCLQRSIFLFFFGKFLLKRNDPGLMHPKTVYFLVNRLVKQRKIQTFEPAQSTRIPGQPPFGNFSPLFFRIK